MEGDPARRQPFICRTALDDDDDVEMVPEDQEICQSTRDVMDVEVCRLSALYVLCVHVCMALGGPLHIITIIG